MKSSLKSSLIALCFLTLSAPAFSITFSDLTNQEQQDRIHADEKIEAVQLSAAEEEEFEFQREMFLGKTEAAQLAVEEDELEFQREMFLGKTEAAEFDSLGSKQLSSENTVHMKLKEARSLLPYFKNAHSKSYKRYNHSLTNLPRTAKSEADLIKKLNAIIVSMKKEMKQ
jgi:hypothetical protein